MKRCLIFLLFITCWSMHGMQPQVRTIGDLLSQEDRAHAKSFQDKDPAVNDIVAYLDGARGWIYAQVAKKVDNYTVSVIIKKNGSGIQERGVSMQLVWALPQDDK